MKFNQTLQTNTENNPRLKKKATDRYCIDPHTMILFL